MGKRRNRKKKTQYRSADVQDYLGLSFTNGEHPERGGTSRKKGRAKSSRNDVKTNDTTRASEERVNVSSQLATNQSKSEFVQETKKCDQNANLQGDYHIKKEQDSFFGIAKNSPAGWEDKSSVVPSLKSEGTSAQKSQQGKKLSVGDIKNALKGVRSDDSQIISSTTNDRVELLENCSYPSSGKNIKIQDAFGSSVKTQPKEPSNCLNQGNSLNNGVRLDPFVQIQQKDSSLYLSSGRSQICKTECDSVSQNQTESAEYWYESSRTFCVSTKSFSEVRITEKTTGVLNRAVSNPGISSIKNKENSGATSKKTQTVTKYTAAGRGFKENFDEPYPKSLNGMMNSSTSRRNPKANPKKCFEEALNRWLPVRNESIRKLRALLEKALSSEASFDSIQLACKYGSVKCKTEKMVAPTSLWEIVSSVGSVACDMAGGITSMVHMFSTDSIQSEFQEILDTDEVATKKMYEERSKYVTEYHYTNEIIRKFGGTTLGETLGKISDAVGITEFFQKIKKANDNGQDVLPAAIDAVGSIIGRNRDIGREVVDAVQELVDSNPACVETVAGVGKSLYGAADLRMMQIKRAGKVGAVVTAGTLAMNLALVRQEKSDILELERKMRDGLESTLGKRIREALDMFVDERKEMLNLVGKSEENFDLLPDIVMYYLKK